MSNVPVPFKLEELQRAEVERWKIEPTRAVLDASKMSQGKTIMAAQFAIEMDFERVLIVGIKDTWDSWSETVYRQSAGTIIMRRMDTTKEGEANIQAFLAGEEGWYYIGHGLFSRRDWSTADKGKKDSKGRDVKSKVHHFYWRKHPVDFFAVDEIHLASNKMSNLWKTMGTISAGWKHGMSGTFWNNQFPNAWAVARFLWGDLIDPSRPRWLDQHCEKSTTYAKGGRKITEYGAELVPGRFVASLPCYTRLDDGDKPPEPIIVPVELNAEQRRVYDDLERDLFVWLKSHPLTVEYPVTLRARLRQVTLATPSIDPDTEEVYFEDSAQSSKYEAAASVLFDECDETFLHLTDSQRYARYLTNRLRADGYVAEEWSGKISGKDREAIKERFIAGEIQHLVAVIAAVSTGLDGFQTACRRIMWHSYSDNATTNEQATYRIYRRGGDKANFRQYFLSARNTKDEGMYSSLVEQQIKKNETLRKSRQIVTENIWTAPAEA